MNFIVIVVQCLCTILSLSTQQRWRHRSIRHIQIRITLMISRNLRSYRAINDKVPTISFHTKPDTGIDFYHSNIWDSCVTYRPLLISIVFCLLDRIENGCNAYVPCVVCYTFSSFRSYNYVKSYLNMFSIPHNKENIVCNKNC